MTTDDQKAPWSVAVVGPTACGKSDLGMELATSLGGEIVCCDSMQVYRGLDIGTGKPTTEDQRLVPHHLLDVVNPDQEFHAGAWARQARLVIEDICARGMLPVIVGGTGLYFRALSQGLFEAPPSDPEIRARHKAEAEVAGIRQLHDRLASIDPEAAARISPNDLVRTSRALEVWEQTGIPITVLWKNAQPERPLSVFRVVYDRQIDDLRHRIDRRVDSMMDSGFLAEVSLLRTNGYAGARALLGLGYKELSQHLDGQNSLSEAVAEIKRTTSAFAKRQRTWFRKDVPEIRLQGDPNLGALKSQIESWRATLA
jgi:tRNA dimethylallyltransferase